MTEDAERSPQIFYHVEVWRHATWCHNENDKRSLRLYLASRHHQTQATFIVYLTIPHAVVYADPICRLWPPA
ncbi:unnamed protein product [Amoebophrya sp. A25]|nr:unnamed protein product [Amoebophrya sp. A25]|eukprot:GSA25T00001097001.1